MGAALELAPFFALMLCVSAVLLLAGYRVTFGALLNLLASLFNQVTVPNPFGSDFHPLSFVVHGIDWLNSEMNNLLVDAIKASEWAWHKTVFANAYAWQELSGAVADLAEGAEATFRNLRHAVIPGLLAALIGPLAVLLYQLRHNLGLLAEHVQRLPHDVTKVIEATPKALTVPEVKVPIDIIRAGAVTVPIPYANPWPRVRDLTREVDQLWDRASGKVKGVTIGGILGLVAASVFSGLHLGWLRCSNTNRVGKFLCGIDHALLDALLAGLAVWLGTLSLEAFAKDVQGVTRTFEGEVRHFWRANVKGPGHDRALGQTGL